MMASSAHDPDMLGQANSINLVGGNSPKSVHSGRQPPHYLDDEGDFRPTRSQLDAIEESLEENSPSVKARRKSQEEPMKVTQFARPPSAHGDSPVGFAFMKAKLPQMDFTRKLVQPNSMAKVKEGIEEAPVKTPQNTSSVREIGDNKLTSSHSSPLMNMGGSIPMQYPPAPDKPPNGTSSRKDLGTSPKMPMRHPVTAAGAVDTRGPTVPAPTLAEVRGQRSQSGQFRHPEAKGNNIGQDPPATPQPMTSQLPKSRSALSDEDLLNVLLLRQRAQQENKDLLKAAQAAKEQEIGDLRDVSHNLYQQLQELQVQDKEKGTEISRLHAIIPQCENRIHNLTSYVDALAKNHRDLMRGSKELRKKQEEAETEKSALALMLKDVHETVENDHRRYSATNKVLIEARHHIEVLEQTVENQQRKLREDDDLLHAERDRSQRLEEGMTKLTAIYHELTAVVSGHPDIILEQLSRVLEISIHSTAVTQAQSQSELKSLLDQCVQMLKKVETTEMVKPQDFGKLDNSIRAYAHSLSRSMERCGRTSESTKDLQRACSSQLQQQLQDLTTIFNAGRTGAQQVLDLREAKATIRERLQATETALAESRQRALALESKEQLHIQRISSLELEAAKAQTKELDSPQLMIRFQELNIRNAELKDEVAMSRQEVIEVRGHLEEKCKDKSDLEERLKGLGSQLDEARLESNKFLDYKLAYEAKAVAEMEKLRRELCEAASFAEAKLKSNYENQLQQLRQLKKVAEDEAEERKRHLEMLQVEKDVVESVASERLQALNELESRQTQEAEDIDTLRARLTAFKLDSEEKQKGLEEVRERLKLAITDLDIKEKKIQSLTASKALSVDQNISNFDANDRPRRSINRSGRQVQFVVEDSQSMAFSGQSPVAAKVTSKVTQSSYFNHTQSEMQRSTARSSSPIDELLDLFPPTPILQMHSREGSKTPGTRAHKDPGDAVNIDAIAGRQKGSRGSQLSPNYKRDERAKAEALEQRKPSLQQSRTKRPTSEISQRQPDPLSRQPSGVLRRPTTRAGRIDKRSAFAAGHNAEQSGANKKSRQVNHEGGLGPIIPDLRSPNGSRISAVRGRQVSKGTGRKTADDKYIRRFSQEFL